MAYKVTLQAVLFAVLTTAATINKRITGGEITKPGEFPYIVKVGSGCGGSLLDSTTVLTAGHCWKALQLNTWVESPARPDLRSPVANIILHPNFVHDSLSTKNNDALYRAHFGDDIAILKLSTPIEAGQNISYAKLPAKGFEPKVNSIGIAAGWGEGSKNTLQKVKLPILNNCAITERRIPIENEFCVRESKKGACRGDSGGPFADKDTGVLIGVSVSASCGYFSSFAKVAKHISFIEENITPGSYNNMCSGVRVIQGQAEKCWPANQKWG